jgi:hypothetical protein
MKRNTATGRAGPGAARHVRSRAGPGPGAGQAQRRGGPKDWRRGRGLWATASINNSREFILATPWTRFEQVELQKKAPACGVLRQQVTLPDQDRKRLKWGSRCLGTSAFLLNLFQLFPAKIQLDYSFPCSF